MKLPHAFRQCCRTRLQNESGLDFVDAAGLNGRQRLPPRSRRDLVLLHRLAAPRRDDDIRLPPHALLPDVDDAILGQLRVAKFGKNRDRRQRFRSAPQPTEFPRSAGRPTPRNRRAAASANREAWSRIAIEISLEAATRALPPARHGRSGRRACGSSAGSRRRCAG